MHYNLLDYIIMTILLLSALIGFRQGFFEALGGIVSTVLAILAAIIYHEDCARYLEQKLGIGTFLTQLIHQKMPVLVFSLDQSSLQQEWFSIPVLSDPANYLARLLVAAAGFLLVFLAASIALKLIFAGLNSLFSLGMLGGINRIMGMALVLVKNTLIMAVLLGISYQPIYMAARMGWQWAGIAAGYMVNSILLAGLLEAFKVIKALSGIAA